ncbi:MAG TPA: hypothetical protein VNX18_00005 [Bryobacteraceae bacterium]|jgi:hypothetical protein|nr:hypothetical protein [Bryobacteraceae bacterium]
MPSFDARFSPTARRVFCAAGLFAINLYVCRELMWIEYLNQMGSIEAAFISLAHYISRHAPDLTWFPLWYGGIPYQDSYPPLLHWIVAFCSSIFHQAPAHSYHIITAFFYCIGPVTLFLLCASLSGSCSYSFFAGLTYSVLSPAAFAISEIRHEIGLLRPRRLQALVSWGEGPHVAGLALLPVAVLYFHRAITRRRPTDFVICAVLFAATVLTNWIAAVALFAAVLAYVCSTELRAGMFVLPVAVASYGMAVPWIPPSTVQTIRLNAPYLGDYGGVYAGMPRNLAVLALVGLALVLAIRYVTKSLPIRFSAIFTFLVAAIVLPAYWWKVYIVPQPERYQLEMELGLAMLVVFAIKPAFDRAPRRVRTAIAVIAILLAIIPAKSDRRFARYLLTPINIHQTIEYKTAVWFDRNLDGRRVFASGSTQFWMNTFTDTPQLGGGFDNGIVNQAARTARYIITSGDGAGDHDAEISVLWLKALGIHAVAVGGPNTADAYRDFRNPRKFDGVLRELWRDGDDAVYLVPQRSASLARVITRPDLVARTPINGIDVQPLRDYVGALDNPMLPEPDFHWTTNHSASIQAILAPQHVVSIQISYHQGWHARVNTVDKPVGEDGIGQIYIEPKCNGSCSIELFYDGGREMRIARGVGVTAWILAFAAFAFSWRSSIRSRRPA